MSVAGVMKHAPPMSRPGQPARTKPRWIAISVELGPGIRLVAASRSRKRKVGGGSAEADDAELEEDRGDFAHSGGHGRARSVVHAKRLAALAGYLNFGRTCSAKRRIEARTDSSASPPKFIQQIT